VRDTTTHAILAVYRLDEPPAAITELRR
jgi:hypothetical protein